MASDLVWDANRPCRCEANEVRARPLQDVRPGLADWFEGVRDWYRSTVFAPLVWAARAFPKARSND